MIVTILATVVAMVLSLANFFYPDGFRSRPVPLPSPSPTDASPAEPEWTPPPTPVRPTPTPGVPTTTDLYLKTDDTCAATASFQTDGEIWRVCDTKPDSFGVRLYIQVKGQADRVIGDWGGSVRECPRFNDQIPERRAVKYTLCLTDRDQVIGDCVEKFDFG